MSKSFFNTGPVVSTIAERGPQGPIGPRGEIGPATITLSDTVVTSSPGSNAAIENIGDARDVILQFTLPRGNVGPQGPATIAVGNTTTVAAGSNAAVTNTGTADNVILDFQIPRGLDGTTITGAASSVKDANLDANLVLVSDSNGKISVCNVTTTYLENIVTLFSTKQDTITGAATTITQSNLHSNSVLISTSDGKIGTSSITATELGYLDGVTEPLANSIAFLTDQLQSNTESIETRLTT
jgi:hypothetical protein